MLDVAHVLAELGQRGYVIPRPIRRWSRDACS